MSISRRIGNGAIWMTWLCCLTFNASHAEAQQNARKSVIVVRPAGWEVGLAEWKEHRSKEYNIVELDSTPDPVVLHLKIKQAAIACRPKATALMLCSDVARDVGPVKAAQKPGSGNLPGGNVEILTPGVILNATVQLGRGSTPTLCTDAIFGDLDDDGCPDLSVGRIPAKTPDELKRMLHRSIVYENSARGAWCDRVHVTAGVGGFGLIADTAIETVTRRFLTEGIPDSIQLNMTYASCSSVYCPDPNKLQESYIGRINQGGLFWVYIGHGSVTHLDYFEAADRWLPIGNAEDAVKFRIPQGPPIALFLACFTGAYDAKADSFAEKLLQQEFGPIAVIAGSRVTMPYGMSQLSSEMIDGCFRDHIETIGELLLVAKRNIWQEDALDQSTTDSEADNATISKDTHSTSDGDKQSIRARYQVIVTQMARALSPPGHELLLERREHVRLMNLLGDPLLKIPYADPIELNCPDLIESGGTVELKGRSPLAGKMQVKLSLVRDRLPETVSAIADYVGTEKQNAEMQRNYEAANTLTIMTEEIDVSTEPFSMKIEIPPDARGRMVISTHVYQNNRWAVGSKRIAVRRPKQ